MARKTMTMLEAENEALRMANATLEFRARDHERDFMTLEKSYEAALKHAEVREDTIQDTLQTVAELRESLAKLQKDSDNNKSMRDHYSREHDKVVVELESIHAVLDGITDAPARKYETEASGYAQTLTRTAVARMAGAFLAVARSVK